MKPFYTVTLVITLLLHQAGQVHSAETDLREFAGTPLPLAIHNSLRLEVLPIDVSAAQSLAAWLPETVNELVILRVFWPDDTWSDSVSSMLVGIGVKHPESGVEQTTYVVLEGSAGEVYLLENQPGNGYLSRLCIWPASPGTDTSLLVLYATARAASDSEVVGYAAWPDGEIWEVDTGRARTVNGWFDARDLDLDGDFELVTIRSMDGNASGFTYQTVRAFNPEDYSYYPDPDNYQQLFTAELNWLNWVVDTRTLIQADYEGFMNRTGEGPFYTASYQGEVFGFDSIVEVPVPEEEGFGHIGLFNQERTRAFARVVRYRDDLAAWLGGGDYPSAWNFSK